MLTHQLLVVVDLGIDVLPAQVMLLATSGRAVREVDPAILAVELRHSRSSPMLRQRLALENRGSRELSVPGGQWSWWL